LKSETRREAAARLEILVSDSMKALCIIAAGRDTRFNRMPESMIEALPEKIAEFSRLILIEMPSPLRSAHWREIEGDAQL
jgi:hypothetical protein